MENISKYLRTIPAAENEGHALVFIVIKDKTQQMRVVFPITYCNLKKELENRGFFFLTYKVTKKYKDIGKIE